MSFTISQEHFSGPLQVLLELLDKKELEIKDVSLVKIADDYLAHLQNSQVPIEYTADFLLIASRLIYLKSRELMPFLRLEEEEEQVHELEDQLRLYKLFVSAAERLRVFFAGETRLFSRPAIRLPIKNQFRPANNVNLNVLFQAFVDVMRKLEPFFSLRRVALERAKSVEERLLELKDVIASRSSLRFTDVTSGARRKVDVVVSFLALLELVRRQIVRVKQADSDIIIERI